MNRWRGLVAGTAGVVLAGTGLAGSLPVTGVLDFAEPVRTIGLGGAGCALAGDPSLGGINPAAGASGNRPLASVTGTRGAFDDFTGQVLGAMPVAGGVLSLTAAYLDAGTLAYTTPSGVTGSLAGQRDIMVAARAARPVSGRLAIGGSVLLVESELFEAARGRAVLADIGMRGVLLPWLAAGVAYRGLGGSLTYDGAGWRLPSTLRAGLAADWSADDGRHALTLLVDVVRDAASSDTAWHLGAEYAWRNLVILRAGAAPATPGWPTVFGGGFGLARGRLRLDYGLRLGGPTMTPHTISLTVLL